MKRVNITCSKKRTGIVLNVHQDASFKIYQGGIVILLFKRRQRHSLLLIIKEEGKNQEKQKRIK